MFPLQRAPTYMLCLQEADLKIQEKEKVYVNCCSIAGTEFSP